MAEHVFEIIFVILMIFSGISMITYVQAKKDEKSWFYNPIEIIEYVQMTKKESGKVGNWFWLFILSIFILLLL